MNKLQKKVLDIYREFKRICDEEKLKYFAIGGTCLGAIRHGGFIPWDDDLDIAMPIEDYKRFMEIAPSKICDKYKIYDHNDHRHFFMRFNKIHDINTAYIESCYKDYADDYFGVFIDVMPVCGLPNDKKRKRKFLKKLEFLSKMNLECRFELKERKHFKEKINYFRYRALCLFKKYNYYSMKFEKCIQDMSFYNSSECCFAWRIPLRAPYKNVFPTVFFEELKEVPFEDTSIYVSTKFDNYLTMDFGNYMALPPIEKRVSVHKTEVIDLEKSFKQYIVKGE